MPALNQTVSLGQLNRLNGSVRIPSNAPLNVTYPFLHKPGIKLALQGKTTENIGVMIGTVPSKNVYLPAEVTINLLKTMGLASQYQAQIQDDCYLGDVVVRPDVQVIQAALQSIGISGVTGLQSFNLFNVSISSVREQSFAGDDPGFVVMLEGYWPINASLFP